MEPPHVKMAPLDAFRTVDVRVGMVVRVEQHEQARRPAYRLWIDFGSPPEHPDGLGVKCSSAQLTKVYCPEDLEGQRVIAAVNLGNRRVAGFESEVLVLGVPDGDGQVVLLMPERDAPLGRRVY